MRVQFGCLVVYDEGLVDQRGSGTVGGTWSTSGYEASTARVVESGGLTA
jgi:hypothetical protein